MVEMRLASQETAPAAKPAARKPARKPAVRRGTDDAKHRRVTELLQKLEQKGKELAASADLLLARLS
jgi:hypothetical protein